MDRAIVSNEFEGILSEHISGTESLESLNGQTSLADDPEIESPGIVNIRTGIENKHNIEVDNNSARKITATGNCKNLKQKNSCSRCRLCKAV